MADTVQGERRAAAPDINSDLGFGSVVARESRKRLLNRDGTFNVRRQGLGFWGSLSAYHYLVTITWPRFVAWAAAGYVVINALFAAVYLACGPGALVMTPGGGEAGFAEAFFFSVETLATIGYGSIAPANIAANSVMAAESLVGLLGFALVAGIVFARFARPRAAIAFSRFAVVAPYHGISALMFRIANQRTSELVELEAKVVLARRKMGGHAAEREFAPLRLERERVAFFPLSWTVVHPIDESSPLHGTTDEDLREREAELLVLINGFDETFSQTVHTRSSYRAEEIVWGARFQSLFAPPAADGTISVDIRRLHEFEKRNSEFRIQNGE